MTKGTYSFMHSAARASQGPACTIWPIMHSSAKAIPFDRVATRCHVLQSICAMQSLLVANR